jgi:diguanylate cyclase (GGDEF)-like protein/putative nucleotidyltransferase with HDIG domain
MREFLQLRPLARLYVAVVVLLGTATVAHAVRHLTDRPLDRQWLILAALTLLTGSFTVKVPSISASLSVSETFVFASVLLFGPEAGAVTVLLECLIIQFWMRSGGRLVYRVLFNTAAPAIAIWVSGTVFFLIARRPPYSQSGAPLESLFLPLAVFTALYFLLNSWLVAFALGFETRRSPVQIWWRNFTWLSVNYFSGASVAALLVTYTHRVDISTLLIIVPLLVVSYLTFRTAMGRVEDSNQHLSELNRLYLSTIETLAMAIDAKDQVTHGHIRRVQSYATGLARAVGVRDEKLIKAIEAAALLHDMGKLAVPEYILNKPGKLTDAEFEKMKLHASVGADILSAIDFPYPVVPIVRHHHENWNGTGYPDRLHGTDIPIGARILAVVDCFDALTSDRPYRPRLADQDALRILIERRGSMYDPLIVDTFVRSHKDLVQESISAGPPPHALNEIASARKTKTLPQLEEVVADATEASSLYELGLALTRPVSMGDACDVVGKHLRRHVPSSLCVFYRYDQGADELFAQYAIGEDTSLVKGVQMPLGQRLSGWVAANRQTIVNSDPALDLGDVARSTSPQLRSCLSTPVVETDELVGVLTLYSTNLDGFSAEHRRTIELIAKQVAPTLNRTADVDHSMPPDPVTDLPDVRRLEQFIESEAFRRFSERPQFSLLYIDATGLQQITSLQDPAIGDDALRHVVRQAQTALRVDDTLFRFSSTEFVALLNEADQETADIVADRIRRSVHENVFALGHTLITVDAKVTSIPTLGQGQSLRDLIEMTRIGTRTPIANRGRSVAR